MPTLRYGIKFPDELDALNIELVCFREILMGCFEGQSPGAYRHFKNISKIWPKMIWHPWKEWASKSLCENRVSVWAGAAAASKTYNAAHFGMLYWMADPLNTAVILTSTTGKMVRKRIWPVIQELYHDCPGFPGNLVDSQTTIQAVKGDDKHGIFALAVADGAVQKAVANIQGIHAKRMLIIIDEATDTPDAIFEALVNLQKGCSDFRIIVIGNPSSRLDPHGQMCEPKAGWLSINVEEEEWETAGVPRWEIPGGVCLHFDGLKSPNIKLGEDKWPFLFTNKDLARARSSVEKVEETVGFWKYTRGFWPPEGVCRTIFSDALIAQHDGRGRHIFMSRATKIAALDPSFGGVDKCKLKFASIGDLQGGKDGIQLEEGIEIPLRATAKEHVHYQIVKRVREECEKRGVTPDHFALDATGEGGGLASIFAREWSNRIVWVEFGGKPSDRPLSNDDPRKASDIYDRRVTELWYSARSFLINGQLKGLDREECIQFCSREFDDSKRKLSINTKEEYKEKTGSSPNDADAVVIAVELAKQLGVKMGEGGKNDSEADWNTVVQEVNRVYEHAEYAPESW